MKFFKWFIELRVKRLDGEQRIIYLANRLIREINGQGHSVMCPDIAKGFGSFDIDIHDYGLNSSVMYIRNYDKGGFKFEGKPIDGIK